MSALFPRLLSDELLYSAIARYRDRLRFSNEKAVLDASFGRRTGIAVVEMPGRLDAFLERLPPCHGQTAEGLLERHTTLPYYRPFLAVGTAAEAVRRLRTASGAGLPELLGIRASTVPAPVHLRYCPRCAEEDQAEHGEAYWHRVHQLPGVLVCPAHAVALCRSGVRRSDAAGRHVFRSLEGADPGDAAPLPQPEGADAALMLRLARDSRWLLDSGVAPVGLAGLQAKYHARLAEAGFMRSQSRVRIGELMEAFEGAYGARVLAALGCALSSRPGGEDWLSRLLRKPRVVQHPLHHLLVLGFLGLTTEAFFATDIGRRLPGALAPASLPCPSAACAGGTAGVAVKAGALCCRACGYTWRPGPRRVHVVAFGSVWEARLRELLGDRRRSLRSVAAELGVTAKTVKRHAVRLDCARHGWKLGARPARRRERARATRRRHRRTWQRLRATHPSAGVKALMEQGGRAAYSYLTRFDHEWLEQHRPPPAKRPPRAPRVDWEERDEVVLGGVQAAVAALLELPGRPVRITRGAVARRAGATALITQHLAKMPRTEAYLEGACETRLTYARRKLAWATAAYADEGRVPAPWELARKAGLRPDLVGALAQELAVASAASGSAVARAS